MLQEILDMFSGIFSGKERKIAYKRLQYLDEKIPMIALEEERRRFEQEKKEMRNKIYGGAPVKEVTANIDDLISKVERYLRVQDDDDYSCIIEHLSGKDIVGETEIEEICDPLDRKIVFKYLQVRKERRIREILDSLIRKLDSIEQIPGRIKDIISQEKDVEELRSILNTIIREEQDKLENLKKRTADLRISELDTIESELSYFEEEFTCLEKYARDYVSEQSLGALTDEVKEYMPREDITYEDIYDGLGDFMVIQLKNCTGKEYEAKMIKVRIAKLIYGRLKKGMFVR